MISVREYLHGIAIGDVDLTWPASFDEIRTEYVTVWAVGPVGNWGRVIISEWSKMYKDAFWADEIPRFSLRIDGKEYWQEDIPANLAEIRSRFSDHNTEIYLGEIDG